MPPTQLWYMTRRKPAPTARSGRDSIFVVDDNTLLGEFAAAVLEAAGFKVEQFTDPRAVLRAIQEADPKPAVLVTDYDMGPMNGLELILSSHKVHPALKTVLLSGTMDDSIMETHPAKVNRFLGKPYEPLQLQKAVADLIRK
jgi:DNA-binding NtrC family response regulator